MDTNRLTRELDTIFRPFARGAVPGCVIGVMDGQGQRVIRGYGLANLEHAVPMQPHTRFRIASVSKQFTVAAVLELAAQGRLDLRDPVHSLLPQLSQLAAPVTVDQLMRNTSGLAELLDLMRLGGAGLEVPCGRDALMQAISRSRHLSFEPGSRFLYCNSNFALLEAIVQRLCRQPLGDYLAQHWFEPLGMHRTSLEVRNDGVISHLATPYLPDGSAGWRRASHGFEHGGEGGLVSSVGDLLTWSAFLAGETAPASGRSAATLAGPELVRRLADPTVLSGGGPSAYARALEHVQVDGLPGLAHSGLWPGYRAEFLHLGEPRLSVVVLTNRADTDPRALAHRAALSALRGDAGTEHPRTAPASRLAIDASITDGSPPDPVQAGTWLDEEEPSLFALAWVNGRPQVTQWGATVDLRPGVGPWLAVARNHQEFRVRQRGTDLLEVDLGAGRLRTHRRLMQRAPLPGGLAGRYVNVDLAATWTLHDAAHGQPARADIQGPIVSRSAPWPITGVTDRLIELHTPGWMVQSQLARVERGRQGEVRALVVFTARLRAIRFERQDA